MVPKTFGKRRSAYAARGFGFLLFLLFAVSGFAQQTYTLSGKVQDKKTSQALPDAAVWVAPAGKGAASDLAGRYTLPLAPGS